MNAHKKVANGASKPLQEFWKFVLDFKSIAAYTGKAAVAAPFLTLILEVAPPWPSAGAAATFAAMLQLVVLASALEFWGPRSKSSVRIRFRVGASTTCILVVVYAALHAFFVYDAPDSQHQEVRGLVYQENTKLLLVETDEQTLIMDAEYDPTKIWEPWSVYSMRMVVLVAWLALFATFSASLAAFVLLRQHSASPPE